MGHDADHPTAFDDAPAGRGTRSGPEVDEAGLKGRVTWLFEEREGPTHGGHLGRYVLISFVGGTGFASLLVLSALHAGAADALRVGAMAWFVSFGALRAHTTLRSRPSAP